MEERVNRIEITKKQLELLPIGVIFKVPAWDGDDFHEWTFIYCKSKKGFIYLGGGMDGGSAIGKIDSINYILDGANECDMPYISIQELKESTI